MTKSTSSDSEKLDFLVAAVTETKASQATLEKKQANLELLVTRVAALESTVADQKQTITSLQEEVRQLKIRDNHREQQSRGLSLRLFNFPGSNDETELANKVYDRLLKPILVAAKAKGDLPQVGPKTKGDPPPLVGSVIESAFRVGKFAAGSNKPPPPIIIRFCSSAVRMAVLLNKRVSTPPSDGPKRMILTEDLTQPNHRKMKELMDDERIAKVWSRDGVIWYVEKGANMPAKSVKSVFDHNDTILSK
jgi:uncharacterized coiled-coil protein SlyX